MTDRPDQNAGAGDRNPGQPHAELSLFFESMRHAPFGAMVVGSGPRGPCLYLNDEFRVITGYSLSDIPTLEEWLQKAFPDPEYRARVTGDWSTAHTLDAVHRIMCKQGERRAVRIKAGQILPGVVFVMLLDVTEQERVYEDLLIRDRALSASVDAMAFADPELKLTYVNAAFLRLWGYEREGEVLGRSPLTFWSDEHQAAEVVQALETRDSWRGELTGKRKDGSSFDVSVSASVARDESGRPSCLVASFRDITPREDDGRARLGQEARLEAAIESLPFELLAVDRDGRCFLQNSLCRANWGDLEGKLVEEIDVDAETHAVWRENNKRAFAGETVRREVVVRVRGEQRVQYAIISPIRVKDRVQGILGINVDITDLRRAEEEQAWLAGGLRQSERLDAIGQLAGGIAHELNNLLMGIQGNAEMLSLTVPEGSKPKEFADGVFKAAAQSADLTSKLLTFARRGALHRVPLDVHLTIRDLQGLLTRLIDGRIQLETTLEAGVSTVLADPGQLHTALLSLGLNARDAMPEGGRLVIATRNVTLHEDSCRAYRSEVNPGEYLETEVTDTGLGLSEEQCERIFEPFTLDKATGESSGLELASVYGCVRSHGGSIRVVSEPGRGTRFTLLLPVLPRADQPGEKTPTGEADATSGRILVVDDEETVLEFTAAALRHLGYSVSTCSDGEQAVAYHARHREAIDLVILDLIMPRKSGRDVFHQIKQLQPDVKVLVSTGCIHNENVDDLLSQGVLGYLQKPYRLDELARLVAEKIRD